MKVRLNVYWNGNERGAVIDVPTSVGNLLVESGRATPAPEVATKVLHRKPQNKSLSGDN
jgi:hypothetical protein